MIPLPTAGLFNFEAPNLNMKAFGKKSQQPTPLRQHDNEDMEAGQTLPETQNQYASIDVAVSKPNNAQLDEYRG